MLIVNFYTSSNADMAVPLILEDKNGGFLDLTGASLHMTARVKAEDDAAVIDISTAATAIGSIQITGDPRGGAVQFMVPVAGVLEKMLPGTYVHDCVITFASGGKKRLFKGSIFHDQGVTRS